MSRPPKRPRAALLSLVPWVALLPGCVPLPDVYPSFSYVEGTFAALGDGPRYAFRVEADETCNGDSVCAWERVEKFVPLTLDEGGCVGHQGLFSLRAGVYYPHAISLQWHTGKTLEVRLYRPGLPLVTFGPRNRGISLAPWGWPEAVDQDGQERPSTT